MGASDWGRGGGGHWHGVVLAWVRDRGEHYLLRPLLLDGITVLTVDTFLFISLFQFLVHLIAIPFSFLLHRPVSLQASEVHFPISGFSNIDSMRAVSTRLPGRRYRAYNLRVALIRLPGRRYRAYNLHVALTLTLTAFFFVSCLTAVGHMRHPFKADLGEK